MDILKAKNNIRKKMKTENEKKINTLLDQIEKRNSELFEITFVNSIDRNLASIEDEDSTKVGLDMNVISEPSIYLKKLIPMLREVYKN